MAVMKKKLLLASKQCYVAQNNLRPEAINFCMQQLMRKPAKPKGDRYTIKEKLMCLALYNTSGSAYRFLANWFHLPCPRTVKRTLHNIPVRAGINEFLLTNLKRSVDRMKRQDRLCTLLFDEMSILPHLEYNEFDDKLTGLENGEMVDHAFVCMIKGITKKWKQPILYTFCKGSMKSVNLQTLLKQLIPKLQAIGTYSTAYNSKMTFVFV